MDQYQIEEGNLIFEVHSSLQTDKTNDGVRNFVTVSVCRSSVSCLSTLYPLLTTQYHHLLCLIPGLQYLVGKRILVCTFYFICLYIILLSFAIKILLFISFSSILLLLDTSYPRMLVVT